MAIPPRTAAKHLGLFVACCITTGLYGGPVFAASLMGILLCHEFGHYLVSRYHGVDVSLPYFIPLPPVLTIGTLGAVIGMRSSISDRKALFDVGAAGPIAGLVVAIPLLYIGLRLSPIEPLHYGDGIEGNSILYALLKHAAFGRWLPAEGLDPRLHLLTEPGWVGALTRIAVHGGWIPVGVDVRIHPMAEAGWVGLLITMVNGMPIGQLDGGHIARAALGQSHEIWSRRFHLALPIVGIAIGSVMFASAHRAGLEGWGAVSYGLLSGALPWLVWTALLGWMRRRAGEYHPPVNDAPLDRVRQICAIALLVVLVLIATPVPSRPAL